MNSLLVEFGPRNGRVIEYTDYFETGTLPLKDTKNGACIGARTEENDRSTPPRQAGTQSAAKRSAGENENHRERASGRMPGKRRERHCLPQRQNDGNDRVTG